MSVGIPAQSTPVGMLPACSATSKYCTSLVGPPLLVDPLLVVPDEEPELPTPELPDDDPELLPLLELELPDPLEPPPEGQKQVP
jgi:hypothetical protein